MNGLPIGFYAALLGLSAVTALASGIYAVLRARNIVRWAQTEDNDVVAGPKSPAGPRRAGGAKAALAVCAVSSTIALGLFALVASGVIGSRQTSNDPTVQRP